MRRSFSCTIIIVMFIFFQNPLSVAVLCANLNLAVTTPFPVDSIVCGLIVCTTCGSIYTSTMIKGVLRTSLQHSSNIIHDVLSTSLLQ